MAAAWQKRDEIIMKRNDGEMAAEEAASKSKRATFIVTVRYCYVFTVVPRFFTDVAGP